MPVSRYGLSFSIDVVGSGYDIAISRRLAPEVLHRHCPLEIADRYQALHVQGDI